MTGPADVAWAAGLFEAEGCIFSQVISSGNRQRHLVLVSTDKDIVDRFGDVMDGSITARKVDGRYKPSYAWSMNHWTGQQAVLEAMTPYFGRRRQAAAQAFLSTPPKFVRRHDAPVLPESNADDPVNRLAWAAGVIEGEGCVANYRRGSGTGRSRWLTVTMTDEDVIDRLHMMFGVGVRYTRASQNPAWATQYEWRVNQWTELCSILEQVLPLLGDRRSAAVRTLFETPAGAWTRPLLSHCKRGHVLRGPGADVWIGKTGSPICRPCRRDRDAASRLASASTKDNI